MYMRAKIEQLWILKTFWKRLQKRLDNIFTGVVCIQEVEKHDSL